MRIFDAACGQPWLITQEWLQTILEIAARESPGPEAVAAQMGKPLDYSHAVVMRGSIAVIPVEGPIVRYADLFTAISGATSIETLAQDLRTALDNPAVTSIVLAVDSPGGEVNGTNEFANMVYAARGQKPIVAYVSDMGASAAYWIASAADEVVVDATARIGSIGVVAAIPDPAKASAKHLTFVSSQSPNKRPDPSTERGRGLLQTQIDALAQVFVESVARNRGVSPDAVLADFGQGGMFVGQGAVDAGLADRVGSFESVLSELATPATVPRMPMQMPMQMPAKMGALSSPPVVPAAGREKTMTEDTPAVQAQEDPRIAAMQARLAELEARDTEQRAYAEAVEAKAAQATARVQALETEARRRDFTAIASGFVNASVEEHVTFMEGLTPEAMAFYVRQQRAAAEQQRQSALFSEQGRAGTAQPGGAVEQLNALITARRHDAKISMRDATLQISAEHPDLVEAAKRATEVRV